MTQRADPPHRRRRKNHTETSTDLKDAFKGSDPKPTPVKKPKKGK